MSKRIVNTLNDRAKRLSDWLPGTVAVASLTMFFALVWMPGMFLVWAGAALRYEWARSKEG